jgi:hypothetical protein
MNTYHRPPFICRNVVSSVWNPLHCQEIINLFLQMVLNRSSWPLKRLAHLTTGIIIKVSQLKSLSTSSINKQSRSKTTNSTRPICKPQHMWRNGGPARIECAINCVKLFRALSQVCLRSDLISVSSILY